MNSNEHLQILNVSSCMWYTGQICMYVHVCEYTISELHINMEL